MYTNLADSSPQWLREVLTDDLIFDRVLRNLTGYLFLDIQPMSGFWSMHDCVHDWTLAALNNTIN
jgi:hypothetical protein